MKCNRCGNEEQRYFYNDHGTWYCRKCIAFGRMDADVEILIKQVQRKKYTCSYTLKYPLTPAQKKAVKEIEMHQSHGFDVLVYAACHA